MKTNHGKIRAGLTFLSIVVCACAVGFSSVSEIGTMPVQRGAERLAASPPDTVADDKKVRSAYAIVDPPDYVPPHLNRK
jgi:hypothetical protein